MKLLIHPYIKTLGKSSQKLAKFMNANYLITNFLFFVIALC